MTVIEILNLVERQNYHNYFVDIHIVGSQVVCFYKTMHIKYKNIFNKDVSYLFPTTFKWENNHLQTTMVYGSVERRFENIKVNGTGFGTELRTIDVYPHYYKLLIAEQFNEYQWKDFRRVDTKAFQLIIEALANIGFPFMRITNNKNIKNDDSIYIPETNEEI